MVVFSNEIFRHLIPQCNWNSDVWKVKFYDIFLMDFLAFNSIPSLIPILLLDILSLTLIYFQLIIRLGDWQIFMLIETFNIPTSIQGRYLDTCQFILYIHPFRLLFPLYSYPTPISSSILYIIRFRSL